MKIRLKLNPLLRLPPRPPGDRRLWILGLLAMRREEGVKAVLRVEFYWRRCLLAACVFGVIGYFAAATGLWFWFKRTPQNKVTWTSIVLAPVQREEFRRLRGETGIAAAVEQLRAKQFTEGFHGLRAGLERSPGNVEARVTLAGMLAPNEPARAVALLEDGLKFSAESPDLLRALFGAYQRGQAINRALEQAARLLARQPALPAEARRIVGTAQAALLLEKGDAAGAARSLAELPPPADRAESDRLAFLRVGVLIRLGRHDEARAELAEIEKSDDRPELFRTKAELAIAVGDEAALEGALRRMRAAAPDNPQMYLYSFQAWHRMRRLTFRDRVEQEFYQTFGGRDQAMQMFAALAVNLSLPEVVSRTQEVAQGNRLNIFAFRVHLTEIALRRGDIDGAFRFLSSWENQVDTLNPQQRAYPEMLRTLVRTCVGGPTQPAATLVAQLGAMRGRAAPSVFTFAASALELSGHPVAAAEVLETGRRIHPHADAILEQEARVAAVLKRREQIEADRREMAGQPQTDPTLPDSAKAALARLDRHFDRGEFVAARDLLRLIRTMRPAWMADDEAGLSLREVRLAVLSREPLTARTIVRAHIDRHGSDEDVLLVVALARQLNEAGKTGEARLLHDEVQAGRGASPAVAAALTSLGLGGGAEAFESAERALAAIDDALQRKDPEHALFLLEQIKRATPAWLASARAETGMAEVRVRLALDQRPAAMFALRDLVLKSEPARPVVFEAVRRLAREGDDRTAQMLARELRKLLPSDQTTADLVKEVEAPQPAPGG